MPGYGECASADVAMSAQECFDALTDFERLPEWQRAIKEVTVLERDEQGRGSVVEYAVDAGVKTVRYRLRQTYDEPWKLASEYLGGDFRDFCGEWRLRPRDGRCTHVELDLRIDPGRFVPGFLRKAIREVVMRRALTDLQARARATGAA
jgi:ribosome-associated toxin RatA of RatAB toxin-antitoxin module